ncbi:MAG: hypothetical protein KAH84_08210 [Thiomargarita sp.]|nr:hypothetical protein [Thiomargarita sp.]
MKKRLLEAHQRQEDFISYLHEKECLKATKELEDIPNFMEGFERAKQQVVDNDVVKFEDVRRDV